MESDEIKTFTAFLKQEYEGILNRWLNLMQLSPDDPDYFQVKGNGRKTVRLLSAYVRHPNHKRIERLTEKIVKERIESNVNLDELVKNINLGRVIVFETLAVSDFPEAMKTAFILEVSSFFDVFLYHATGGYTELKETIIRDKNRFIQEMHSDRLTILGQIAASFAHEFRNPLTSIKGFMALIEQRSQNDDKTNYYLSIMKREMKSLEEKVTRFLYLSKMRGLDDQVESIDLIKYLKETVEFLYPRFLSEGIEVITQIQPVKMVVCGVTEQIKQVFLNIFNNAVEELSHISGRKQIILCTKICEDRFKITIANNGPAIEAHMLENIFEPFISTKELGTGLGLAVCKQIIEKHGGTITVSSDERLTAFHIELKRVEG